VFPNLPFFQSAGSLLKKILDASFSSSFAVPPTNDAPSLPILFYTSVFFLL